MVLTAIDFNNDGLRDLLWRNYSNGANVSWLLNETVGLGNLGITPVGDVDWKIVGAADVDGDGVSNLFWRYTGNNLTLKGTNLIWGNLNNSAPSIVLPQVSDLNWRVDTVIDLGFTLSGKNSSAMVWRNYSTGQNLVWFLEDGVKTSTDKGLPPVADPNWEIAAADDFNQDGTPDLLWRNYASGQNVIWYLDNGFNFTYQSALAPVADVNWRIEGSGDFSGDNQADILWRNRATGQTLAWKMTTLTPVGPGVSPGGAGLVSADWKLISGSSDFNGDGSFDLLWWNSNSGVLLSWLLNEGGTYIGAVTLTDAVPESTGWQPITVSLSGIDGESSIFWQNRFNGQSLFWQMDLTNNLALVPLPTITAGWLMEDALFINPSDDFEGGGVYVLRNYSNGVDQGKIELRVLNDQGQVVVTNSLGRVNDLNWRIADVSDLDGNGQFDLLWRNYQTGQVGAWLFKDTAYSTYQWLDLPAVADVNWQLVDAAPLIGTGGDADFLWRNYVTGQTLIWQMDGATFLNTLAIEPTIPANSGWSVL
jgi:hypothetical protein